MILSPTYCMPGTLPCTGNVRIIKIDKVPALREFALLFCFLLLYPLLFHIFNLLQNSNFTSKLTFLYARNLH